MVDALDAWASQGAAAERIIATKYNNEQPSQGVAFTRSLCPYPQTAQYAGQGDATSATGFNCVGDEPDNNSPPLLDLTLLPERLTLS